MLLCPLPASAIFAVADGVDEWLVPAALFPMRPSLFDFTGNRRPLGLLLLALLLLLILLTISTPTRAAQGDYGGQATSAAELVPAARASNNHPAISSTPPVGVMGPSHRAPVKLRT
jgi:hypothetical protein